MSQPNTEGLLTQIEARAEAKRLNDDGLPGGLVALAVPYPFNSWGGTEKGWTIVYAAVDQNPPRNR